MISEHDRANMNLDVHVARTPELIRAADVAWAVSGSVCLELLAETLPAVILYKVNRIDLWIARPFIKAKYICLVNLLADSELMPEYLTCLDVSGDLASWAARWLDDPTEMERAQSACRIFAISWRSPAQPSAADRIAAVARESIVKDEAGRFEAGPPRPVFPIIGRCAKKTTSLAYNTGKAYHDVERTPVVDSEKPP